MKILVISDTHGKHANFDAVLEKEGKIDLLIHAGDVEDATYIESMVNCPIHMVGGNNDYFSFLPKEKEFFIGPHRVFLTHGHMYHLYMNTERLRYAGVQRKADIIIFGHTHQPKIEEVNGILLINPGSLSEPRQRGREATYVILELDKVGEIHCELRTI